ncbi:hypothetical protein NX059_002883 [Plenodomus lindquistii]|nr:hypothetical protein NX059_002883 [Plenodomus lindquistii]
MDGGMRERGKICRVSHPQNDALFGAPLWEVLASTIPKVNNATQRNDHLGASTLTRTYMHPTVRLSRNFGPAHHVRMPLLCSQTPSSMTLQSHSSGLAQFGLECCVAHAHEHSAEH